LRDSVDHAFFLDEIRNTAGKILDIGVGTGRFFMDAVHDGKDVYGIDISDSMLEVLKGKLPHELHSRISHQDFIDFHFDSGFDLIVAPFRVIMHIPEKENQLKALNNVYRHLAPGGKFIFDMFVPDLKYLVKGMDNFTDFEGEYEKGKMMRRIVTTKPDLINQLIHITFRLEWEEGDALKTELWDFALRFFFRYELEHLVERSEFKNYRIYGDYQRTELNETSKEFIVECYK
jgi:SAM-dependent methyltransferase